MMRMLALVVGVLSVSVMAQTAPQVLQTASPDSIRVSQGILRGMAEAEPDIVAPDGASDPGMVSLLVLVSKTGAVQEAVATSGPAELRKAAVDGVMGWRYRPYLLNGEPREIQSTILLQFNGGVGKRAVTGAVMGGIVGMSGMGGAAGSSAGGQSGALTGGGAVPVAAGVMAGALAAPVAPVYPPIAKAAHVQGLVVLHALISKIGDIEDLQVVSGPPMLQQAAVDAVRQWKYRPYLLNGVPTEVQTTINVNFTFATPKAPDATSAEGTGETAAGSPAGDGRVRVSSGTMAQLVMEKPMPVCSPPVETHVSGTVILQAVISKEGEVKDLKVVSAPQPLGECSMEAVRRWRYRPYLVDGVPTEVETTIMLHMLFGGQVAPPDAR
jgi:TonB family protein